MRKIHGFVITATVALAVGWFGSRVWSDDPPKDAAAAEEMAKWAKLGAPGEEHARMKAFVGTWDAKSTMEGGESTGTVTNALIYGGRYLATEFKGSFGDMQFEGRGLLGFDNGTKRWNSCWIDSMSTPIVLSEGAEKEKGKVWEFKSKYVGPTGLVETRDVWKIVSDKEYTIESFKVGGGDQPTMTLRFTRK